MMLIALDFMQVEDHAASIGKFLDGAAQCKAIDNAREIRVAFAKVAA